MSEPTVERLEEQYDDSPLERLQLLGGDDAAIAAFLDEIDVRGPRDRDMLRELARTSPLARPERFDSDHRRVLVAITLTLGVWIVLPLLVTLSVAG